MSRVHDALRKAATESRVPPVESAPSRPKYPVELDNAPVAVATEPGPDEVSTPARFVAVSAELGGLEDVIRQANSFPYTPAPDALLVHPSKPKDAPSEEFRSLRTRLNHLQNTQPLHTLVVTSASPGEGKSFTACNLAMSQAQIAAKRVLLADFDFRRPSIDRIFGLRGKPGLTDYLRGKAGIQDIVNHLEDSNLYVITAGESVPNPLELLNLKECGALLEALRDHFDWVIIDSPPLLFAADGNLLSTLADGTILVVRIGSTTYDSVSRALQSLSDNNVLGIVVNGADRGELYSRYSYYQNYYYESENRIETGKPDGLELESLGN